MLGLGVVVEGIYGNQLFVGRVTKQQRGDFEQHCMKNDPDMNDIWYDLTLDYQDWGEYGYIISSAQYDKDRGYGSGRGDTFDCQDRSVKNRK